MNSRPRRKRNDRWRQQVRPSGGGAGLGVECLEPRFLLSGSTSFVGVPPRPADLAPVPGSSAATGGSGSESTSGTVTTPTSLTSATTGVSGPPSVLVAVSTPTASGAANVTVTPISTTDGTISLPDVAGPSVVDVLSTVQAGNLFFLPDVEDAASIGFNLHSLPQTEPVAEQLDVYSASGKTFQIAAPPPSSAAETLTVRISDVPDAAAGLFVRVESPPGFAQNTPRAPWPFLSYFLMRITRNEPSFISPGEPFPSGAAPGGRSPTSGIPSPAPTTPPVPLSALERYLEAGVRPAVADNPVPVLAAPGGLSVPLTLSASAPTGPLPARSAAPLGGVLATGDPVPQVDRRDAVAVDLELIGVPSGEPAALADAGEAIDPAVRLTTVRGPGGFPLLASAQKRPAAAALVALPWAARPVLPEAKLEAENPLLPLPTALRDNPEVRTRPSAGAGLTLALSLVFGPELPNLAAAFRRDEPPLYRPQTRRRHRTV
jgi:hypothetical protein